MSYKQAHSISSLIKAGVRAFTVFTADTKRTSAKAKKQLEYLLVGPSPLYTVNVCVQNSGPYWLKITRLKSQPVRLKEEKWRDVKGESKRERERERFCSTLMTHLTAQCKRESTATAMKCDLCVPVCVCVVCIEVCVLERMWYFSMWPSLIVFSTGAVYPCGEDLPGISFVWYKKL